jgi:hypothetical protein
VKPQEIVKLKALDPTGCNGTIASVLLDPNINQAHYAEVLYYLLSKVLDEKSYLERASNAMTRVLQSNNLLQELNECLELKENLK